MIKPKHGPLWKLLSAVLVCCIVIFFLFSFIISIKYNTTIINSSESLARKVITDGIYYAAKIYDPCDAVYCELGPAYQNTPNNVVRFESFSDDDFIAAFSVVQCKNERIVKSKYYYSYQPFEEPRLHEFVKKYNLKKVISPARNELEIIILLRNWVRSQFKRKDLQPALVNFDFYKLLENRDNLLNKKLASDAKYRPCNFYPLALAQTLAAMGINARVVAISSKPDYSGHGMVEVWSNQFKKWIVMDADLNLHYERNGIPLNLLEIHKERYNKRPLKVNIVYGTQTSGDESTIEHLNVEKLDIGKMIGYHSYFSIRDMRNDWMTNHYFRGHPKRSDRTSLYWVDIEMPTVFTLGNKTSNVDDFYWSLNQTEIYTTEFKNSILQLFLKTMTPNFDYFRITIDENDNQKTDTPFLEWQLHKGRNIIEVVSVNKFGREGIESRIIVDSRKSKLKASGFQ